MDDSAAPTVTDLLAAFNERLIALVAADTGLRTAGMNDAKWDNWHIIDFSVRDEWQHLGERGNTGNERWSEGEPAYPQVEWESATGDAIYHDDIEDLQVPEDTYSLMRFAVDPARIDAVMELVSRIPIISAEDRARQLADEGDILPMDESRCFPRELVPSSSSLGQSLSWLGCELKQCFGSRPLSTDITQSLKLLAMPIAPSPG